MPTKSKRSRPRNDADAAGAASADDRHPTRGTGVRVAAATAVAAIQRCSRECASTEVRGRVHALARAVRRGAGSRRRLAALDDAVAACLNEAGGADRWPAAEAAAWGLSRLTRRRRGRAAESARHVERLVAEADAGCAALRERDTHPARFVLVLARLFADVEKCREGEADATAALAEEITRLVTTSGAVVLNGSPAVVERVERWTGCREVAAPLGGAVWDDDVERRWALAAGGVLRLLGPRGHGVSVDGTPRPMATLVTAGRRARRTARMVRGGGSDRTRERGGLLPTDLHDAAAATAVIRTGWDAAAVRVLVEYRDSAPYLEVAVGDRLVVAGLWEWGGESGGRPLEAEGAWTVSGWESDRKAAFLEIAAPLGGGLRLERQVVVLRRQRIVLFADAIVPASRAIAPEPVASVDLAWRAAVPLAPGLTAEPAVDTRELLVYDGAMRCLALPPALPEWRVAGRGGFGAIDGRLVLEQVGHRRLYAPLWLDCDPRRIGRPLTWRQLTVADTRRNLPPHQAAGFRVQAGRDQWLLYRSLDVPRNRTVLGCNVSNGFLLGRIRRSGEVARTVEIE